MGAKYTFMGIAVENREDRSPKVQAVLSEFGGEILMRAGIPSSDRRLGLISLTLEAEEAKVQELKQRLESIDGVQVRAVHLS